MIGKHPIKPLTRAEMNVMNVLWDAYYALTVNEIVDGFSEPKPAYTTVATFLKILEAKGYVEHKRKERTGRTFYYSPMLSREKYITHVLNYDTTDTLTEGSARRLCSFITTQVQKSADMKGNINPELTILRTGTPPKDCGTKTTIWERRGNFDGFSWKNYTSCSWKWDVDDISVHLREVAIRKDHNVRINVCKGVPKEHIDYIISIMKEYGVTNYKFVNQ